MSISIVAGLGNPGRAYAKTRHNAGFAVIDAFAARHRLSWKAYPRFEAQVARWDRVSGCSWLLAKPATFMNESGRALSTLARFHKTPLSAIIVIYDDLGLDLGRVKISLRGGAGGHNGVASLLEHLGGGFIRYRIGIGPKRPPEMDLKDFVLGKFTSDEQAIFNRHLPSYIEGLGLLIDKGPAHAMNQLNRKDQP